MRVPVILSSLTEQGIIDRVLRPLKSGKEAEVFLVESQGEVRVAKVYKSIHRSFKNRAEYTEGRTVRGSRDQRAIARRTRHGKAKEEEAWKSAEVDVIHRLFAAGVRVPTPYHFIDGVLIMELVRDGDGSPAPRLGELSLSPEVARAYFEQLLGEVVKMLCAGVVHGDLSDYNILVDADGPVVIDFPQAVDAAANRNAKKLLIRDVNNLSAFLGRCIPGTRRRPYGEEIWAAFENNMLTPDYVLSGAVKKSKTKTDVSDVLGLIDEADADEQRRLGETAPPRRRREVVITQPASKSGSGRGQKKSSGGGRGSRGSARNGQKPRRDDRGSGSGSGSGRKPKRDARGAASGQKATREDGGAGRRPKRDERGSDGRVRQRGQGTQDASSEGAPKKRRRRRRRGGGGGGGSGGTGTDREEPFTFGHSPAAPSKSSPSRPESASDEPSPRRRRRRRRAGATDGPQKSPTPAPRDAATASEDGAPRRRRRRRRKPPGD